MATSNRAAIITKAYQVLKKHYKPVLPNRDRSLMDNLVYACCLEDASYEAADECYARLHASYFDRNEIRVATIRELGEAFRNVPNSTSNALNLKNTLQSVFESQFSFDLEHMKKLNQGKALAMLEKMKGATLFTIAYATQNSLGGHAIPLGKGGLDVMYIIGAIDEKEMAAGTVPGLERTIAKNNGPEFSSLLHQLAADLIAAPFSPNVRAILLEIDPDCKSRLPKRIDKKKLDADRKKQEDEERELEQAAAREKESQEAAIKKAEEKKAANKPAASKKSKGSSETTASGEAKPTATQKSGNPAKTTAAKTTAAKALPADKKKGDEVADKKKPEAKKGSADMPAAKKTGAKPPEPKKAAKAGAETKSTKAGPEKKKITKKSTKAPLVKKANKTSKKSASKDLARRKPR